MIRYGVVAHGGVGSPPEFEDGCRAACEEAYRLLKSGKSALDAVVGAASSLEDDGRFNAGSGSVLRLDGRTVEMDASVMDSGDNIGIVISIRDVKNPICVARAVIETPHIALSGQGATIFAKKRGFEPFPGVSSYVKGRYEKMRQLIREGKLGDGDPRWLGQDIEALWNSNEVSFREAIFCDTVGVVALDKEGVLAVANSTGGASPMMIGRVGDTPMIGCGFYAGPSCAVTATGIGEEIIKRMLAKTVYDLVLQGEDIKSACEKGVGLFPNEIPVGIIGISKKGYAIASNRKMASHAMVKEA